MSRRVYSDTVLLRVYFEGVLFPYVKSVTVNEQEGSISAQIEVPPSVAMKQESWVGMLCHVFYANKRVLSSHRDPGNNNRPPGKGWPILFQGELSGESSHATVQSENIVLSFKSHARHFDQTLMYFYDPAGRQNVLDVQKQAVFIGNSKINIDTSGVLSKRTQVLTALTRRTEDLDGDESRNIAFSSAVLEILRSARDNHAMFSYFDDKLKLSQRFAAYADPDVQKILQLEQMNELIERRSQSLPSFASLMHLIEIPTSIMKYNWNHLAQPKLRVGKKIEGSTRTSSASDLSKRIRKASREFAGSVFGQDSVPSKIQIGIGKGVSIPADYVEVLSQNKTAPQQTDPTKVTGVVSVSKFSNAVYINFNALLEGEPGGNQEAFLNTAFQNVISNYAAPNFGQFDESQKKETEDTEGPSSGDLRAGLATSTEEKKKEVVKALEIDQATLSERDELNEFTITPNMMFAQPPKCNVFTPAMFTGYGITKDHLREPTRLYGRVQIVPAGRDAQNTAIEWYIAPFSQAYHFLDGQNLSKYSDEYEKFLSRLPNQIQKVDKEDKKDPENG